VINSIAIVTIQRKKVKQTWENRVKKRTSGEVDVLFGNWSYKKGKKTDA
jgi:hypothetical protein